MTVMFLATPIPVYSQTLTPIPEKNMYQGAYTNETLKLVCANNETIGCILYEKDTKAKISEFNIDKNNTKYDPENEIYSTTDNSNPKFRLYLASSIKNPNVLVLFLLDTTDGKVKEIILNKD